MKAQLKKLLFLITWTLLASTTIRPLEVSKAQEGDKKIIPFRSLIYSLIKNRDIHATVDELSRDYETEDFKVKIPFTSHQYLHVLQTPAAVKNVLRSDDALLGYANHNFTTVHGHKQAIGSLDTNDPLWGPLHKMLFNIFSHNNIKELMDKHASILTKQKEYNLNDQLEKFFLSVWSEYCFGPMELEKFKNLRNDLVEYLKVAFHQNTFNRIPLIGSVISKFNAYWFKNQKDRIDQQLGEIVSKSIAEDQGAFSQLYHQIQEAGYNPEDSEKIVLDNAFLSVLVYDFIYIVSLDAMVNIAKKESTEQLLKELTEEEFTKNRKKEMEESLNRGFLFPFRFRQMAQSQDGGELNQGDYCVLNLKKSKQTFSYGPRSCAGRNLFQQLKLKLLDLYQPFNLAIKNPAEAIEYAPNKDVPAIVSRHDVLLSKRIKE